MSSGSESELEDALESEDEPESESDSSLSGSVIWTALTFFGSSSLVSSFFSVGLDVFFFPLSSFFSLFLGDEDGFSSFFFSEEVREEDRLRGDDLEDEAVFWYM